MAITSSITTLANALKNIYLDPIVRTINEDSGPVYAAIEKSSENIIGNDIKFAMQYGRHGGVGAIGETDDLPSPSPRKYIQATANLKNLAARINFTEKLMLTTQNNAAAFVDAVSTQMEDVARDAKDMVRRNLLGKADGIMDQVKTQMSSTTTCAVKGNIKKFYVGQCIDIFTVSGSTVTKAVDGGTIVDVDYASGTFTLGASASAAANAYISLHNNYLHELTGLGDIMTVNSTIYGINRSNYKWYNPQSYDKSSGGSTVAFSSMYLQEAIDDIDDFVGVKPDFITCSAGMQRAYINEQNTYKRNIEYKDIDGGYRTMSYNDVAISKEKYMPANTIYLLTTEYFTLAQLRDWHWMDEDGDILHRVADKAGYEAALTKYCELLCKFPAAQAVITGITEI